MTATEYHERLEWARRRAGYATPREAADAFGWNQNTYKSHDNGVRVPRDHDITRKYARAFGVDFTWLLTGQGSPEKRNLMKIAGRIGAGAEIFPEGAQDEGEHAPMIEVPIFAPQDAVAFEVVGDSMWPRFEPGEVIICWKHGDTRSMVDGWEAAVLTEDGHRYLKKIRRVGEDRFDLESHNASPIRNQRLEWVMKVGATVRAGEWRLIESKKTPTIGNRLVRKKK